MTEKLGIHLSQLHSGAPSQLHIFTARVPSSQWIGASRQGLGSLNRSSAGS